MVFPIFLCFQLGNNFFVLIKMMKLPVSLLGLFEVIGKIQVPTSTRD